MATASLLVKKDQVHAKVIEGKLFLIDFDSAVVLELNEVGALIWNSLAQSESLDQILDRITQEFNIGLPQAKKDCMNFLKELKRCDLVALEELL